LLAQHFGDGRRLDTIAKADAEGFVRWLSLTRHSNTTRRHVGWAKEYFNAAGKAELIATDPRRNRADH
jgi:hypothetical protein